MAHTRPPRPSPLLRFLRWWLPGLICAAGLVIAIARGFDETGIEAFVVMIAAGLSLLFMNLLLRAGFSGDRDRDVEDEARRFFDEHGHWPDEPPPRRRPGH